MDGETETKSIEIVGVAEIAKLARTSKQAVGNWRARYDHFPPPYQTLASGPIWDKRDILEWLSNRKQ